MAKAIHEKYRAQMAGNEYHLGMLIVPIVSILVAAMGLSLGLIYVIKLCCNDPQPEWLPWSIPVALASIIIFMRSSRNIK